MSEIGRLAGVFFSPGKAFADIGNRPNWYVPILLSIIVTTTFLYLFSQRVGWEQFLRAQNAQSTQLQTLDATARAQAEAVQLRILPYITWAGGLLGPLLTSFVVAAVLKFLADTVMGAGIGFKKTLAVVTYARLPYLLSTGLSILVMYLKPAEEFDLQNPLMVNAAAFLPMGSAAWMKALGGAFDLFTFWSMALMAIGFSAAAKRMSTGKAFGMILFPWALYVIITVGSAAAFRR